VDGAKGFHSAAAITNTRRGARRASRGGRKRREARRGMGSGAEDGHGNREAAGSGGSDLRRGGAGREGDRWVEEGLRQLRSKLRRVLRRREGVPGRNPEGFGGPEGRFVGVSTNFRGFGCYQTRLPDNVRQCRVFQDDGLYVQGGHREKLVRFKLLFFKS